jgi:flagellar hook-associated protein 1 FlgK
MSLDAALSIASSGLANINRQLDLVSQNVANAGTPGYAREVAAQQSVTAGGVGMGVRSLPTRRETDDLLQSGLIQQNAVVAGLTTRQAALQAIDQVQGTPGAGNDLASLVGKLQDAFSSLANNPDSQPGQQAVVIQARALTNSINTLSTAYATQRQGAQDAVLRDVATANATLATIGGLSDRIMTLKAAGQSTADLENQRDAAVSTLSGLIDVKSLTQPNGDTLLLTAGGLSLPIHSPANPLAISGATIGAGSFYPGGGVPALTLQGVDVTRQVTSGRIGANLTLRDTTMPTDAAELDEFAQKLASRFDSQGLRLFTDPTGAVPAAGAPPVQSGYVGIAGIIGVNAAVSSNATLVRDGTQAIAGSAAGATAFTPNPAGGPAGFATLIGRILDFTFGAQVQAGVTQPASATTGLGPAGTLAAPYTSPASLAQIATALTASQSQDSGATTTRLDTEQAVQTSLSTKLSAETGVSIDTEMSTMIRLQNAYGANAKMITAAQAMWTQLLQIVP